MATFPQRLAHRLPHPSIHRSGAESAALAPSLQAYRLLRTVFTVAPILFGLDKFTNLLADWTQYLAPLATQAVPVEPRTFMYAVGAVEIVAGLLVAARPKWGAAVVALWLAGIIVNLLLLGSFYDVALRDFGLFVAALALFRLAAVHGRVRRGPAD